MTREQAIDKLVELDVAKWGESEREASRKLHSKRSHALLLNAVAHYDLDNIDTALAKTSKGMMTKEDRRVLKGGG